MNNKEKYRLAAPRTFDTITHDELLAAARFWQPLVDSWSRMTSDAVVAEIENTKYGRFTIDRDTAVVLATLVDQVRKGLWCRAWIDPDYWSRRSP